jgi:archaemetzincin
LREIVEIFYFVEREISENERVWVRNSILQIGFEYEEVGFFKIPQDFFAPWRGQYNAGYILRRISELRRRGIGLGIVDCDIFFGDLNFVFGLASPTAKVAVVSLLRLNPEFYGYPQNDELFMSRVKKEVIHELGHVMGLVHCSDKTCVMSFSNSIHDVDAKTSEFCQSCRRLMGRKNYV